MKFLLKYLFEMIPAKIKTEHESHKNINSQSSMVPIEAG